MTEKDPQKIFASLALSEGENEYLRGQAKRIRYLGDLVQRYCAKINRPAQILDVGPHFLTRYLLETINPRPQMSTLGYPFQKLVPPSMVKESITIDLNECESAHVAFSDRFDIITFCEVVEHLLLPPDVILSFLKRFLNPLSGVIILGTPNAVCLANRLRMSMGENPFHTLPKERKFRGARHIREYTMQELRNYGQSVSLKIDYEEYCNYWGQSMFIQNIAELEREVPSYRTGLTIVYRNDDFNG